MGVYPTWGEIKGELRQLMTEDTAAFFDDGVPGLASWVNEGMRLQDIGIRKALKKSRPLSFQLDHPYLTQLVGHAIGKVLKGTSRLLTGASVAGINLKGREILAVSGENIPAYLFQFMNPAQVALARSGVGYLKPTAKRAFWTWRDNQLEPDFIFATPDGTAPFDLTLRFVILKRIDELLLFKGEDDEEVAPLTAQFMIAPKTYALGKMVEEQGEDPQIFEERFPKEVAQGI